MDQRLLDYLMAKQESADNATYGDSVLKAVQQGGNALAGVDKPDTSVIDQAAAQRQARSDKINQYLMAKNQGDEALAQRKEGRQWQLDDQGTQFTNQSALQKQGQDFQATQQKGAQDFQAGQNNLTRTAEAGKKAAAGAAGMVNDEMALGKEYRGHQVVKDTNLMRAAHAKIQSATPDTAQGQMSLIYGYMKMLDPGSTVREGEYASAKNTNGIPDQIVLMYNKAIGGDILKTEQVSRFKAESDKLMAAQEGQLERVNGEYRDTASRYGMDPNRAFGTMPVSAPQAPQAPQPVQAPTPNAGQLKKMTAPSAFEDMSDDAIQKAWLAKFGR